VNYFVVLPDGQRYGPANATKLSQWVLEGRVMPDSVLQDVQSGRMMAARDVPGIQWPNGTTVAGTPSAFLSFLMCLLCPLVSSVGNIFGILKGIEALNQGHPKAQFAIGLNIGALILSGIAILVAATVLVQ
jgi:hypothetical protein